LDESPHIQGVGTVDNLLASIALRRPRVRIPPGPLTNPHPWGFLLSKGYIWG